MNSLLTDYQKIIFGNIALYQYLQKGSIYVFIGKSSVWALTENDPGFDIPDPSPSITSLNEEISDIISLKRVTSDDISLGIKRFDWTSGTYYRQYNPDYDYMLTDLHTVTDISFYVMTDDYNVYKCIYNNEDAQSTTKPQGQSAYMFETSDGYIWKYMFSVSALQQVKFLTEYFIPVKANYELIPSDTQYIVSTSPESQSGHGKNALYELGGFYTIVSVDLEESEDGFFPTNISYRKTGLITDIVEYNNTTPTYTHDRYYGPANAHHVEPYLTETPSLFIKNTEGTIPYITYHLPVQRTANQIERTIITLENS